MAPLRFGTTMRANVTVSLAFESARLALPRVWLGSLAGRLAWYGFQNTAPHGRLRHSVGPAPPPPHERLPPPGILPPRVSLRSRLAAHSRRASPFRLALPPGAWGWLLCLLRVAVHRGAGERELELRRRLHRRTERDARHSVGPARSRMGPCGAVATGRPARARASGSVLRLPRGVGRAPVCLGASLPLKLCGWWCRILVEPRGIEPLTFALPVRRSPS